MTSMIRRPLLLTQLVALLLAVPPLAMAADHVDGPAAIADPSSDVNDIFAWMQDANRINLALNTFPGATAESRFSDAIQYVFHVDSVAAYGQSGDKHLVICTFTTAQLLTCTLDGDEIFTNVDASNPAGVLSEDGRIRIFAGLRNDAFFFSSGNFNVARRAVSGLAPSLSFDEAGCPAVDQPTKDALVGTITGNGGLDGATSPPADFFALFNGMAISIQAERTVFGNGPLYAVSASTNRRP